MTTRTLKDFVELCKTIDLPEWTFDCFEGMDFVIYMNEYGRIVESATESRVKTYITKLSAPQLWDYNIGYYADIHNATLKMISISLPCRRMRSGGVPTLSASWIQ